MIASLPGLYFSYIRQAGMAALLEEKREAEAHAAEACRLLDEARAAASTAATSVKRILRIRFNEIFNNLRI